MNSIKILATGVYLPKNEITNEYFNKRFGLDDKWIEQRTGIKKRFWAKEENGADLAINATKDLIRKSNINIQEVGLIIVASTKFDDAMPGVAFEVQKEFNIPNCICINLLAGCSGYINALDIAKKYLELEEVKYALIIGVETISKSIDVEDVNTAILLGDGAGATLISKAANKAYAYNIESIGQEGDILTCKENEKLYMEGKKVYKFATTMVSDNINKLLKKSNIGIGELKYIIPHQSNLRILESLSKKIGATQEQMYINIENVGNTFNASIPIALNEISDRGLLKENDRIVLAGYGGGLNIGSILLEL